MATQSSLPYLAIAFVSLIITACSGGGGSDNNKISPSEPTPVAQVIVFAKAGPVKLSVGDHFDNPATGQGSGSITYQSSDEQVATVDSNGVVKVLTVGSTIISADIAADSQYLQASASYQVNSVPAPADMTAWIGEEDTLVNFPGPVDGYEFYRSNDKDCDLENYTVCTNGQLTILNGQTVLETASTLYRPAFYELVSRSYLSSVTVSPTTFAARSNHKVVEFKGRLWLTGGYDGYGHAGYRPRNDIWSSNDGIHWELRLKNAPFPPSEIHNFVVFNEELYLIVGYGYPAKTEIWSSPDGITWNLITDSPPFSGRLVRQVVVHNEKIWLIGGTGTASNYETFPIDDIWSSEDGITWTLVNDKPDFAYSWTHKVVSFNNALWLIGSAQYDFTRSEIWTSRDGKNWTSISSKAPFGPRVHHQLSVFDNKLWLLGGDHGGGSSAALSDTWSSSDGISWKLGTAAMPFLSRTEHQLVNYQGKIWLIGGYSDGTPRNDIWSSPNGIDWRKNTSQHNLPPSVHHQVAHHKGSLVLIPGYGSSPRSSNDVWKSKDGTQWTLHATEENFPRRFLHQVTVHDERLWLIGGGDGICCGPEYGLKSEIWSSSDGLSWKLYTKAPGFSPRRGHAVASHNERLWVIGGSPDYGKTRMSDVWSSSDGVNWVQETADGGFTPRIHHQVTSFRNKLWLIGGDDKVSSDYVLWSSENGIHWTPETTEPALAPRFGHQLTVHKDRLWLIGGWDQQKGDYTNEVWSSDDGTTWTLETSTAPFAGRAYHQVVSDGDHLWMVGGFGDGIYDDVWRSENGKQWRKVHIGEFTFSVKD